MKDETDSVATEEFVGLKPKIYYPLVDESTDHEKAKDENKYVLGNISKICCHGEYRDVLLNNKRLIHSKNRAQGKNHRIGIC